MDAKAALIALERAPVQHVSIADLRTDDAFQPRVERLVPYSDKGRTQRSSDRQTAALRLQLEASQAAQLPAVLVADIDGVLFIVDGHHRLRAYALAKRETIPARVWRLRRHTAALASKLVNCPDRSLDMHPKQYAEAAWQWLADVRRRGVARLSDIGESYRTVQATFRLGSKTSVERMWKDLLGVDPKDYAPEACDPGTGFPLRKYVCQPQTPWKDMREMLTPDQLIQHKAAKAVAKACGALGDLDPAALALALAAMPDALRELAARDSDEDDIARLAYDDEGRSGDALLQAMQPIDADADF